MQLYRPGAKVGDGGTASAIKKQLKTGELVGGVDHIEKGKQRIKNLNNIIQKEQLNKKDLKIATKLIDDLRKAINKKYDK